MKSLISINRKFMEISPHELVELINNSKYTDGVEIYVDISQPVEKQYLANLVSELKTNNLILQVHGDIEVEINQQLNFIKVLENYSSFLGYPILLTLHTIYDQDMEISLQKTAEYINYLVNNIDNKIIFCLENLNDLGGYDRPNKKDIKELVSHDDDLFFTYDIGHEIVEHGRITDLNENMVAEIKNIHLHSFNSDGLDHCPIYQNDLHWDKVIRGLKFLKTNNYDNNIVFEYDLYYCHGKTLKDKIVDYLKSIDFVSEKYNNL